MAQMIVTNDGGIHVLFDYRDFADLVQRYIGYEAEAWLSEYISETYGADGEMDELVDYYEKERARRKEVLEEIRAEAEKLSGLIRQPDLNRMAISDTAGKIGCLTWREVNRP